MKNLLNFTGLAGSWGMAGAAMFAEVDSLVALISAVAGAILTISLAIKNMAETRKTKAEASMIEAQADRYKWETQLKLTDLQPEEDETEETEHT